MGLISDYLEQCRDRSKVENLDPCMIVDDFFGSKFNFHDEIYYTISSYSKSDDENQKKQIRQQLIERSARLETIKSGYLMGEKLILAIRNSGKLQSTLILDTVALLLSEFCESYQSICDLRQEINQQLGETITVCFEPPYEEEVRKNILQMISVSIILYLQDSSVILDTSNFRKVVCDLAEMIRYFEQEKYNQPNKKIVCYYLEKKLKMKIGHFKCANCGNYLLEHVPYCLNCYERN